MTTTLASPATDSEAPPSAALVAAVALLGCAVIHAFAAYAHRDAPRSHVVFFVAIAIAQGVLALRCARSWRRSDRFVVAALSLGVTAVWLVSRTWGLPSSGKEEVGMGDAIASALQIVTATVALVGLAVAARTRSADAPQGDPATARPRSTAGVALVAALGAGLTAFAVPAVAGHQHGANPLAATSISAVWANAGHPHTGTDAQLTGNGVVTSAPKSCSPTRQQVAAADALVASTAVELEKYRDVNTALADGFKPLGFEPNGLHHYISKAYRDDPSVLDPSKPESIVYGTLPDASMRPIGVMYMMPKPGLAGPQPGGCLMTWHSHGFPFATLGQQSAQMVHVWTIPVPGGPFAHESGPDYARLYLGKTPAPAADVNRFLDELKRIFVDKQLKPEQLSAVMTLRSGTAQQRCSGQGRAAMAAFALSPVLQNQICDPLLGRAIPGATAGSLFASLFQGADGGRADGRGARLRQALARQ